MVSLQSPSVTREKRDQSCSDSYTAATLNYTDVTDAGYPLQLGDNDTIGGFHNKLLEPGCDYTVMFQIGYTPQVPYQACFLWSVILY